MATSDIGAERRMRLAAARLYLVCDSTPGGRSLPEVLRPAIEGGVDIVQLREKRLADRKLTVIACAAGILCRQLGALFIVNDRPVVAREAGADGVHVGQDDMPVAEVRELVGPDMLIGLSTHTPVEIDAVAQSSPPTDAMEPLGIVRDNPRGANYIGVGPVHLTPTKPARLAVGLELVRYAASHSPVPFFVIGGIHTGNIDAAIEAGANRIAVVRAIAEASAPEPAARALRVALTRAGESPCV
jgi:thiamine-phosphate pyrophosphorylase